MQVFTSPHAGNHASPPPLSFLQTGCPSCHPTNSIKALKALINHKYMYKISMLLSSCKNMNKTKVMITGEWQKVTQKFQRTGDISYPPNEFPHLFTFLLFCLLYLFLNFWSFDLRHIMSYREMSEVCICISQFIEWFHYLVLCGIWSKLNEDRSGWGLSVVNLPVSLP